MKTRTREIQPPAPARDTPRGASAREYLPSRLSLASLRRAAHDCRGCELYRRATQVVFGAGPAHAALMVIGEVPGDKEDLLGAPFVGPAGKLLDEAFSASGIQRGDTYLTNAVKHFKWEPRGKRRLHARPKTREISACRPWLEAEIQVVRPRAIICLGAVAAQSLLGSQFRITRQRGEILKTDWAPALICSWHPSAVLRAPTPDDRRRMRDELFRDVQGAARCVNVQPRPKPDGRAANGT